MQPLTPASAQLSAKAVRSIKCTVERDGLDRETGGALFGFDDEAHIVVSEAGDPGPQAVRGRRFFMRDLAYTRTLAAEVYASTGAQWLGEWHLHPEGLNEPSLVDLRTYIGHLRDPELRFVRFLSAIVTWSARSPEVDISLWVLERQHQAFALSRLDWNVDE